MDFLTVMKKWGSRLQSVTGRAPRLTRVERRRAARIEIPAARRTASWRDLPTRVLTIKRLPDVRI